MHTHKPSWDIVILAFDDATLNAFSEDYGVWPWPRSVHADMIEFLNRAGVKMMLYDIMFVSHKKREEASDRKLGEVFRKHDNVYVSMNLDHDLAESQKLGKDLTPQQIELLQSLSVRMQSELNQPSGRAALRLKADPDGALFFDNDDMTFNHFRSILPELTRETSQHRHD